MKSVSGGCLVPKSSSPISAATVEGKEGYKHGGINLHCDGIQILAN